MSTETSWQLDLTPFSKPYYSPESKQKSWGSCLIFVEWKAGWRWGHGGWWGGPMVGTPCSVYRGSMSSCLNPWGSTATKGSDICRWYGGRFSRGRPLLVLLVAWDKSWGCPWIFEGGKGRQGSDICRWNLKIEHKDKHNGIKSLF